MKKVLTLIIELITMASVGETDANSAEVQLARDSQLGHRRNAVAAVSQIWDCCISRYISEISLMPKKPPCRRQGFS